MVDTDEIARRDAVKMKEVSDLAKRFIVELNGEQEQLQIEEAILSGDGKNWLVTVSYLQMVNSPNELQKALALLSRRVYKRVTIDRESLQVLGMKNWAHTSEQAT